VLWMELIPDRSSPPMVFRRDAGPVVWLAGAGRMITNGLYAPHGRVEPALGVDEEGAAGRDLLAGCKALQHGEAVAHPGAGDDRAALVDARPGLDVDDLAAPGVDDRRLGYAQDPVPGRRLQVHDGRGLQSRDAPRAADPGRPPTDLDGDRGAHRT